MSRLWALLGIAILALALSACGGEEGAEGRRRSGTDGPGRRPWPAP